ncbi:MAG: hypothetical protein ACK4SF_12000 [Algoriphagus aquaeductus]|uniref:hypothetical protein n=1 Tax=Algoriphagus aquaeductus TaxID=475299 RepID=UPI00391B3080
MPLFWPEHVKTLDLNRNFSETLTIEISMDYLQKIISDFELHSVEGIKECFNHGVNPNQLVNGKPLIYQLINMYTRGPRFKSCIRAFVDQGLEFEEKILLSVLLDDAALLETQ